MTTPIYYINLDRTPARAAHMMATFSMLEVQAERVSAVDGRELDEPTCRALNPLHPEHEPHSPGEIGCWLSHRAIWTKIANADQAFGIVFEDDIVFSHDAAQFLSDLSWLPKRVDFVKLDACPIPVDLRQPRSLPGTDRTLRSAHSVMISTAGYLISKRCARQLLERTVTFRSFVDLQLFDPKFETFHPMKVWQLFPAICSQSSANETIADIPPEVRKSDLSEARKARDDIRQAKEDARRAKNTEQQKMKFGPAKIKREIMRPLLKYRLRPRDLINRFWWRMTNETIAFRR